MESQKRKGSSILSEGTKAKLNQFTMDLANPGDVLGMDMMVHPEMEIVDFYGEGQGRVQQPDWKPATTVKLDEVMEDFHGGHISFVGAAGSGKSVLLKAIARQVLRKRYKNLESVEIVHFIPPANHSSESTTTGRFLFQHTTLKDNEINEAMEFARDEPDKVLFVLDSLDTLRFELEREQPSMSLGECVQPEVVLWNFLSGKLFPGCRIITSSRQYAIRNFKGDVRAQKIIALTGLTKESMSKIIVMYFGEKEGAEIMQDFERNHPELLNFCATPLHLTLTLMAWKLEKDLKPSSMSGILVVVLNELKREQNIRKVVDGLKKLSFYGIMKGRVVFNKNDIEDCGLSVSNVTSLAITAKGFKQKLLRGADLLYFAHLSIQELLAAMFIAEMDVDDFVAVLSQHIHTLHYAGTRRILYGLILDMGVSEKAVRYYCDIRDQEKKIPLLQQSIEKHLSSTNERENWHEALVSLFEAKDGANEVVKSKIAEVDLTGIPLSRSDIHSIGSVIGRCENLNVLQLSNCGLHRDSLSALEASLRGSDLKIRRLCLSGNTQMGEKGLRKVGQLVKRHGVEQLYLEYCQLASEHLKELMEGLDSAKLRTLILSGNEVLESGIDSVGRTVINCGVTELYLQTCQLTSEALRGLFGFVRGIKMHELNVSGNSSMGTEGVRMVGKMVKSCMIERLNLASSHLTIGHLEVLRDELQAAKVGILTRQRIVQYEKASNVAYLSLTGNVQLGQGGGTVVGQVVRECGVKILQLQSCQLSSKFLQSFQKEIGEAEMEELYFSGNRGMGADGVAVIGQVVKQCRLRHLDMSSCGLDDQQLRVLAQQLRLTKIDKLYLDDERIASNEDLQIVCSLARFVNKELSLRSWRFGFQLQKRLQEAVDKIGPTKPKIITESDNSVGPEGGTLEVDGCRIRIPNGALTRLFFFSVSVRNEGDAVENCIPISPELTCEPSVAFSLPVNVQIPLWCFTDSENVKVKVMGMEKGSAPKLLIEEPLRKFSSFVEFTKFRAYIDHSFYKEIKYRISVKMFKFRQDVIADFSPSTMRADMTSSEHRPLQAQPGSDTLAVGFGDIIRAVPSEPMTAASEERRGVDVSYQFTVNKEFGMVPRRQMQLSVQSVDVVTTPTLSLKIILNEESVTECYFANESDFSEAGTVKVPDPPDLPQGHQDVVEEIVRKLRSDIEENMRKNRKERFYVGIEGKTLELYGCILKFPPHALDETTPVELEVSSQAGGFPDDYMTVTPIFSCSLSGAHLKQPVKMVLPMFCFFEGATPTVFTKKKDKPDWSEINDPIFDRENSTMEFEVKHFCRYVGVFRTVASWLGIKKSYRLINKLFYRRENMTFIVLTHVDDEKVGSDCREPFKGPSCIEVLELPHVILAESGDTLSFSLADCAVPPEPAQIQIDNLDTLMRTKYDQSYFRLPGNPETRDGIFRFNYIIHKNGKLWKTFCSSINLPEGFVRADATAEVEQVVVRPATKQFYDNHLNNTNIYQFPRGRQKGSALIINNSFRNAGDLHRQGSATDLKNMKTLWKALGLRVTEKEDLSANELKQEVSTFVRNIGRVSLCVLVIMSHGGVENGREVIVCENDGRVAVQDILQEFSDSRCRHLIGTPKLIFLQYCRGELTHREGHDTPDATPENRTTESAASDRLVAYSTQANYVAFLNTQHGSWFINAISNVFMQNAHELSVQDMLPLVNNAVSKKEAPSQRDEGGRPGGQIGENTESLRKRLFLFPGWPEPAERMLQP